MQNIFKKKIKKRKNQRNRTQELNSLADSSSTHEFNSLPVPSSTQEYSSSVQTSLEVNFQSLEVSASSSSSVNNKSNINSLKNILSRKKSKKESEHSSITEVHQELSGNQDEDNETRPSTSLNKTSAEMLDPGGDTLLKNSETTNQSSSSSLSRIHSNKTIDEEKDEITKNEDNIRGACSAEFYNETDKIEEIKDITIINRDKTNEKQDKEEIKETDKNENEEKNNDDREDDKTNNLHNVSDVKKFLFNYNIIEKNKMYEINDNLKNIDINASINNMGLQKHIYKYCIIKIILNDEECNVDNIVTNYYDILNTRIINKNFYCKLEKLKLKLLNIDEDLHDYIVKINNSKMKCLICKESFIEILFLPCGHLILCSNCYDSTKPINCIECSTYIEEHHHIYF